MQESKIILTPIPQSNGAIKNRPALVLRKMPKYQDLLVVVSRDRNHFILMREGWENSRRVHGCVVHAEIRNDKIWIHYDGIEDGITEELVTAGVPKDHIVLAFHPPQVREHTGYALA